MGALRPRGFDVKECSAAVQPRPPPISSKRSALFLVAYVAVDEIADIAFIFLLILKDLVFGRGRNFIFPGIRFLE